MDNLRIELNDQRKEGKFTDFIVKCNTDVIFHTHKCVMAASAFGLAITTNCLTLKLNLNTQATEILIEYIYLNCLPNNNYLISSYIELLTWVYMFNPNNILAELLEDRIVSLCKNIEAIRDMNIEMHIITAALYTRHTQREIHSLPLIHLAYELGYKPSIETVEFELTIMKNSKYVDLGLELARKTCNMTLGDRVLSLYIEESETDVLLNRYMKLDPTFAYIDKIKTAKLLNDTNPKRINLMRILLSKGVQIPIIDEKNTPIIEEESIMKVHYDEEIIESIAHNNCIHFKTTNEKRNVNNVSILFSKHVRVQKVEKTKVGYLVFLLSPEDMEKILKMPFSKL